MTPEELEVIHHVLSTIVTEQSTVVGEQAERVQASAEAFAQAGFSDEQLHQLLALAVDRLAIRQVALR